MSPMPDSIPEPSTDGHAPKERLNRLAEQSPFKRRIPRTIVGWAFCFVIAAVLLVLSARLFSDQANAVFETWVERITKNVP